MALVSLLLEPLPLSASCSKLLVCSAPELSLRRANLHLPKSSRSLYVQGALMLVHIVFMFLRVAS